MSRDVEAVAVLGAGTMGHGIAQVAAAAGCRVHLYDVDEAAVTRGMERIAANLDKGIEKGKVSPADKEAILGRLTPATDLAAAVADADFVIEAAPERIELKTSIFTQLSSTARPEAILATNTSSLPITRIAAAASDPSRVIGMHFFNPVHVMKLVEIVRAEQTSPATIEATQRLSDRMGKESILVKDTPGFATSRLGVLLGLEAIRMLEDGVASAEDIDKAMELGYRHPMGPLRLTDLVGLDVRLSIAEHLHREIGEQFRPPALLRQMVEAGKLGKKSGEGFYEWD